jgi:SAM-dependent methyltransferase
MNKEQRVVYPAGTVFSIAVHFWNLDIIWVMDRLPEFSQTKESEKPTKREWLDREIKPIKLAGVKHAMQELYEGVLAMPSVSLFGTKRGAGQLLERDSKDYARLPGLHGKTAKQIFKSLKPGSEWLDIGCGSGRLINDVLEKINPKVVPTGFDARTWSEEKNMPEFVSGDVDELSIDKFDKHPDGFDLITSSALFYHLPDYWRSLVKAIDLLKVNGTLLISTFNRPVYKGDSFDDRDGRFEFNPEQGRVRYYNNRNIFNYDGKLLSMAEAVGVFNGRNPGFRIEYRSNFGEGMSFGDRCYGGGISGVRKDGHPVDMSWIFYCFYPDEKNGNSRKAGIRDISFVVAKNEKEISQLRREGFVSVQDRIDKTV